MRRYVNGLRYDTETATEVTSVGSDFGKSDFQWWTADLYVTKSGRWFLHGRGNAASRFSKPAFGSGNGRQEGSGIEPLLNGEALRLLEDANEFDAIDRYFPDEYKDA